VKNHRSLVWLLALAAMVGIVPSTAHAEKQPWSERAAKSAMERWPEVQRVQGSERQAWSCELGALLEGMEAVWLNTADPRYFNYIRNSVDRFVSADGSLPASMVEEDPLGHMALGRQLLLLYGVTQDRRYMTAATQLYKEFAQPPRYASGGMGRDEKDSSAVQRCGLYMAEPFHAGYAATFHRPEAFSDIAHRLLLTDEDGRDAKSGIARQLQARDMGWQMRALVDTLASYPEGDAGRRLLRGQLERDAAVVARRQDAATGLWHRTLNISGAKGNDPDASATCLIIYALARGVREGDLPSRYLANAQRGYQGILSHFIQPGSDNAVPPTGTMKDAGAFLLASVEMENLPNAKLGRGDTVLLDAWFNSQKRPDAFGEQVLFHYKWNDLSNSGYSLFGHIFNDFGAQTKTLSGAPSLAALRHAQVYIIVSPDIPVKNPNPHYVRPEDAAQIAAWVKSGGVLVMMENDPANADLDHLNLLAELFGIHYNNVLRNRVDGDKFEMGKVPIEVGGLVFHDAHTAFMKETCTVAVKSPAVALLRDRGDILMATAKYGQGTVFAAVDPWLYNEYTDGRKLPAEYDNYAAGKELVRWILEQVPRQPANQPRR